MRASCVAVLIATAGGCGRFGFDSIEGTLDGEDQPDAQLTCAAGTHDEDGDKIADGCDVCPEVADPAQADRDGDAIGDACDPRPDGAGDVRLLFDPFAGTTLAPTWTVQGGTWTLENDGLTQTETVADRRIFDTSIGLERDLVVETRVTFLDLGQANDRNAGVALRFAPTMGDGWLTGVYLDPSGTLGALKIWRMTAGSAGNPTEAALPPPQVNESYVVITSASGTRLAASAAGTDVIAADASPLGGAFALRTHRLAARYDHVTVYRLGGPL